MSKHLVVKFCLLTSLVGCQSSLALKLGGGSDRISQRERAPEASPAEDPAPAQPAAPAADEPVAANEPAAPAPERAPAPVSRSEPVATTSNALPPSCPGPGITRYCDGRCVHIDSDDNNCGACGNRCSAGKHCDGHLFCRDADGNL